jgi:hypothetical protein
MADIVRLAIVYDTSQAAASLNRLDAQTNALTRTTALNSHAQATLKRGLVGLAMQATATSGPVGQLSQALLLMGGGSGLVIGVAAVIGTLALAYRAWTSDTREAAKAQEELIKQLQGVGIHAQLMAARFILARLQMDLAETQKGRKGLFPWSRGPVDEAEQGLQQSAIGKQLSIILGLEAGVAKWQKGIADDAERTRRAHEASVRALDKLAHNAKIFKDQVETAVRKLDNWAKEQAVALFRGEFVDRGKDAAATKGPLESSIIGRILHDQELFRRGLYTMADAIEEFVVTGTFAFTDFLNNILRLLYRDFTGGLVEGIVHSIMPGPGGGSGDGPIISGTGSGPSVQSNVTFQIQALDSQSVATFLDQNGARIAGIVAGQADRSRAVRRKFLRG